MTVDLSPPSGRTPRGIASRVMGRGRLLRQLRQLERRVYRFAMLRAASADERAWAARLADALEAAFRQALDAPGAAAALEAVNRRAAVSAKVPDRTVGGAPR